MSLKQIQQLAEKNRRASKDEMDAEMKKRGITSSKKKKKYVHVDRSEDPRIATAGHRTIFQEMKKVPFRD
ncbi:hypothetical protein LCGC14_1314820 [marine sediment metagenome]|uniref:Uncharacterized protein n=1 Tax=marine sediment metagenome TaxID=412755 RepID=A0A0F9L6F8_9ZZZZ